MKLNNDLLVIDLETTSSQDENGYQVNNDIIQIGAVLLNRNLKTIGTFERLVKPREPVSEFIIKLTGITNEMVESAPSFVDVATDLELFVRSSVDNIKNVRICAWGTYFDMPILRRQYKEYKHYFPFSGTAFDIKTLAMLWMGLSNKRTDKLGVEHIANIMKIGASGNYHNAMVDAACEAEILQRIVSDLTNGVFLEGKLRKIL